MINKNKYKLMLMSLVIVGMIIANYFVPTQTTFAVEGSDITVSTFDELRIAISNAPNNTDYTIAVNNDINVITTIIVPAGKKVKVISNNNNQYVLKALDERHFEVVGSLTLENITIKGESITTGPKDTVTGGVSVNGASAQLTVGNNTIIEDCYSNTTFRGVGGGGAIYVRAGTLTMLGGILRNNEEDQDGGAVRVEGGKFELKGGQISNNTSIRGAAVSLDLNANFIMSGGKISANQATDRGGAVHMENSSFTMSSGTIGGSSFTEANTSTTAGGGIYSGENSAVTILGDSQIGYNKSASGGGIYTYATWVNTSSLTIQGNAKVHHNQTTGSGGGIYVAGNEGATFTLAGQALIHDNSVTGIATGGGIAINGAEFIMKDASGVIDNQAPNGFGGGIYLAYAQDFIMQDNAYVKGNKAETGGGIQISQGDNAIIKDNALISENEASLNGGGIYLVGINQFDGFSKLTVTGGTITKNVARANGVTGGGGGIYYTGVFSSIAISGDTSIIDNHAPNGHGGGIHSRAHDKLNVSSDVIFDENTASIAYVPDPVDVAKYPNIQYKTISIPVGHSLNNYDVNYTGVTVAEFFDVVYHENGGVGTPPPTVKYLVGVDVNIEQNTDLSLKDHVFVGWNTKADGTGDSYEAGDIFTMPNTDVHLYAQWRVLTGNLTISKNVTGTGNESNQEFTFKILLKDKLGKPLTGSYNYEGSKFGTMKNEGEIKLSDEQSVIIQGLPVGTQYEVIEIEANANGYTTTSTNEVGTINIDGSVVTFVNHKNAPIIKDGDKDINTPEDSPKTPVEPSSPSTGDTSNIVLYIAITLVLGLDIIYLKKRKHSKN